ncbi:hypothetical protein SY89_00698 [Halolamina pelagica]|uniref:Uncharacterized protein n=1 Tax=Halolamina pelagica TaxID=699431 RepID=A0A0P7HZZ8_9EURY|nr:hypothetical protein [Halolamina pelagica]KPN29978.1 hypothetical protein SY89_00698 [Halolamina pelagica]
MSEEPEPRERYLRMNSKDREAIKKVKDEHFDGEVPLGYAARYACEQLVEDTEDTDADSGGVRL